LTISYTTIIYRRPKRYQLLSFTFRLGHFTCRSLFFFSYQQKKYVFERSQETPDASDTVWYYDVVDTVGKGCKIGRRPIPAIFDAVYRSSGSFPDRKLKSFRFGNTFFLVRHANVMQKFCYDKSNAAMTPPCIYMDEGKIYCPAEKMNTAMHIHVLTHI